MIWGIFFNWRILESLTGGLLVRPKEPNNRSVGQILWFLKWNRLGFRAEVEGLRFRVEGLGFRV